MVIRFIKGIKSILEYYYERYVPWYAYGCPVGAVIKGL